MIIDCLSELRGYHPELTHGDILLIAGNVLGENTETDYKRFYDWCHHQKYRKVIFIAGNHDTWILENRRKPFNHGKVEYLCDSGTVFEDYKVWGTPCSVDFFPDAEKNPFEKIPDDVDILMTHIPPRGILDQAHPNDFPLGSSMLMGQLTYRFRPFVHVFGKIPGSYGKQQTGACRNNERTISVNACIVNEETKSINKPIRVTL